MEIDMSRMTAKERLQREAEIKHILETEEDVSITDLARRYGVTQQSMQKFLKVRGWKTQRMEAADRKSGKDPVVAAQRAERRKRRAGMKETVKRD